MKRKINISNKNLISKYRNYILLGLCGILAVISVITTIEVSVSGAQISGLQNKEAELSNEKRVLESQLVRNSSVTDLANQSSALGFVKPANIVYLSQSAPVANIP